MNNSVIFLIYLQSCTTITTNSRVFPSPQMETLYPLAVTPILPPAPGNHWSTACLCRFVCSGHLLEMDHIVGGLPWHAFTQHHVFTVYPCWSVCQGFAWKYSWHGYFPFRELVLQLREIWVGSTLTLTNNIAMIIYVQVFVWTYVFSFLGYIPNCGIAEW